LNTAGESPGISPCGISIETEENHCKMVQEKTPFRKQEVRNQNNLKVNKVNITIKIKPS